MTHLPFAHCSIIYTQDCQLDFLKVECLAHPYLYKKLMVIIYIMYREGYKLK